MKFVGSTSNIKFLSILNNFYIFADTCELMQGKLSFLCKNYQTDVQKMEDFDAGSLLYEKFENVPLYK